MSIAALNWAFALKIEGPPKAVLLALAYHANEHSTECWPGPELVALEAGVALRTVRKSLQILVQIGAVEALRKPARYRIMVGATLSETAPRATSPRPKRHHVPQERHDVPNETAPRAKKVAPRAAPIENIKEHPKEQSGTLPPTPFGTDLLAAVPAPPDLVGRAIGIWNDVCGPFCGRVQKMTEQRRRRMRTVIVNEFHGSMEDWLAFCDGVAATPFLVGTNDRGWVADFDWMLTPANFVKVSEGKYLRSGPAVGASALRRELGLGFLDDAPAFEGVTLNGD